MNNIEMSDINQTNKPKVIFLMGPTASGKSALAIKLHKFLPVELISVDSALIYRGMDIGTDKPNADELQKTPHSIINILDPSQTYSAENFRQDALREMARIIAANRIPLLVGGTMFYHKALLEGLSPLPSANQKIRIKIQQYAAKKGWNSLYKQLAIIDPIAVKSIHPNDLQRLSRALEVFFITGKTLTEHMQTSGETLPYVVYKFAVIPESRKLLHERIEKRFYRILASGFEKEVRSLHDRGDLHVNMPSIRCIGYRQMWSWFKDEISYDEMIYQTICATRQLAKRQLTWLRSWKKICWLNSDKPQQAIKKVIKTINPITD